MPMNVEAIEAINVTNHDETERANLRRSLITARKLNDVLRNENAKLQQEKREIATRFEAMQKTNRDLLDEVRMAKADRDLAREDATKQRVLVDRYMRADEQRKRDGA